MKYSNSKTISQYKNILVRAKTVHNSNVTEYERMRAVESINSAAAKSFGKKVSPAEFPFSLELALSEEEYMSLTAEVHGFAEELGLPKPVKPIGIYVGGKSKTDLADVTLVKRTESGDYIVKFNTGVARPPKVLKNTENGIAESDAKFISRGSIVTVEVTLKGSGGGVPTGHSSSVAMYLQAVVVLKSASGQRKSLLETSYDPSKDLADIGATLMSGDDVDELVEDNDREIMF